VALFAVAAQFEMSNQIVSAVLSIVIGALIVGAIFVPTMERLRIVLTKFSELEIPTRDEIREYLGIVPQQQEEQ
jgi:hypothetical protein